MRLSVGIQYGEVVIGDIGSARRMEFTVLGDAVNVASRLEAATREIGCRILVGAPAFEAAQGAISLPANAVLHDGIAIKNHAPVSAYSLT